VDDYVNADGAASGSATFIDAASVSDQAPEPVAGTFQVRCEET
jgi:hypothetical protein